MHQKQYFMNPKLVYDSDEIKCKHVANVCGCTLPDMWSLTPKTDFLVTRLVYLNTIYACLYMKPGYFHR